MWRVESEVMRIVMEMNFDEKRGTGRSKNDLYLE